MTYELQQSTFHNVFKLPNILSSHCLHLVCKSLQDTGMQTIVGSKKAFYNKLYISRFFNWSYWQRIPLCCIMWCFFWTSFEVLSIRIWQIQIYILVRSQFDTWGLLRQEIQFVVRNCSFCNHLPILVFNTNSLLSLVKVFFSISIVFL